MDPTTPVADWTFLLYCGTVDNDFSFTSADLRALLEPGTISSRVNFVYEISASSHTERGRIRPDATGGHLVVDVLYHGPPVDTAAAESVASFIDWAARDFPSQYTALIFKDHGSAVAEPAPDPLAPAPHNRSWVAPTAKALAASRHARAAKKAPRGATGLGSTLADGKTRTYVSDRELRTILEKTARKSVDIYAFDACTMSAIEVAYELRKVASYMIASELFLGREDFPYASVLTLCSGATRVGPLEVARHIVNAREASGLTAVDLSWMDRLSRYLDDLACELSATLDDDYASLVAVQAGLTVFPYAVEFDLKQVLGSLRAALSHRPAVQAAISKAEDALTHACFGAAPPVAAAPPGSSRGGSSPPSKRRVASCGVGIFFPKPNGVSQMIGYGGLSFPHRTRWGQFISEFCYAEGLSPATLAVEGRRRVRPTLTPHVTIAARRPSPPRGAAADPPSCNGEPGDVLLQGFHWTSYRSAGPSWYGVIARNAAVIRGAGFTTVWFPPPSESVMPLGYMPTRWNVFDTAYGTQDELKAAIKSLGIRAIADVVINHRCGVATPFADFDGPAFALKDQRAAICVDDECGVGTGARDTGENQPAARDLDHENAAVQAAIQAYLKKLRSLGFKGWRYDEARGYGGAFVGIYNQDSAPELSVGEFWDTDRQNIMDWIDATGGRSMAFDFPTRALLKAAIASGQFAQLKTDGKPAGAIGWWPSMCVTFLDDHDTGQDSAHPDPFGDVEAVLQGYAYILTHPGIPCVFWSHFFDLRDGVQSQIKSLMSARTTAGVTHSSVVNIVVAEDGRYAATVEGERRKLAMKIGPGDWDPGAGWSLATSGVSYAVWVK